MERIMEKIKTWAACAAGIITGKWVTVGGILLTFAGTIVISLPDLINLHRPAVVVMFAAYAQMTAVAVRNLRKWKK